MQFYLLLKLVFVVCRPLGSRLRLACLFVLMGLSYALHLWIMSSNEIVTAFLATIELGDVSGPVLTHSVLAHFPHFLLGVAAGYWLSGTDIQASQKRRWDVAFWVSSAAVLVVLATPLDDFLSTPYGRYNLPFVPVLIAVVVVATPRSKSASYLLELTPVGLLGVISYGFYLFHIPMMKLSAKLMNAFGVPPSQAWTVFGLSSFCLTVAVASVSYLCLERPILRASSRRKSELPRRENAL